MKNLLPHEDQVTSWYQPYYLYDVVSVYNKHTSLFENRKRATGVFFDTNGEILILNATCSLQDTFSRKKARSLILGRFHAFIKNGYLARGLHFLNLDEFIRGIQNIAAAIRLNFYPKEIGVHSKVIVTDDKGKKTTKEMIIMSKASEVDIGDVFYHFNFVVAAHTKFFDKLAKKMEVPVMVQPTPEFPI